MARVMDNARRQALAAQAVAVLQEEGLDLPNATLAERLQLKRPTLLYYFPNKASILESALEAMFTEQVAFVMAQMAQHEHPLDQLDAQIRAVHAFHHGREGRVVFLTQAIASLGMQTAERFLVMGDLAFEAQRNRMKVLLREAIDAGRMWPCDVDALVRLVRSTVDGLMVQRFMTGCELQPVHDFFKSHVLDPLRRVPSQGDDS